MRPRRRGLPVALWPAAGLLGPVVALSFFERVQSYLHYLSAAELWPVYATTVFIYLPFGAALILAAWVLQLLLNRLPPAGLQRLGGSTAAATMLLAAVLAFGLRYGFGQWLQPLDATGATTDHLPALRWWLIIAVLLVAWMPAARRAVANLAGLSMGMFGLGLLAVATLPWLGWGSAPAPGSPAAAGRPHVLLVTFDALTASHMSLYGYARPTTPFLDRYAAGGTSFDRFYAASNFTTPTINSILTGTLPDRHRATQLPSWPVAAYREHSLPAVLRQAGYRTVAVSTNPLAGPYKNGYGAWFDEVASDRIYTYFSGRDGPSRWLKYLGPALDNPIVNALWRPIALAHWAYADEQQANRHYEPDRAFDDATALIERHAGGPLFVWVHLLPPHSPYAAPAPYLGSFDPRPGLDRVGDSSPPFMFEWGALAADQQALYQARYDESVRYLDARVGVFLDRALARLGPDTLVMISADHGESFTHGYGGHAGPLLTESLVRIPLIVRGPGVAAGVHVAAVSSQVDLAPTIADFAGAAAPPSWQGRSLRPWLSGASLPPAPAWTMNLEQATRDRPFARGSIALVDGPWKMVRYLGTLRYPKAPPLHESLHDVVADPGEQHDLSAERPDEAVRLRAQIDRYLATAAERPSR